MSASGERERAERGLRGLTDTGVNKLLYFKHWKIPINFKVNALLYSEWWLRSFNVSSNTLQQHIQTDSWPPAVKPSLCWCKLTFIRLCLGRKEIYIFFIIKAHEYVFALELDSAMRP